MIERSPQHYQMVNTTQNPLGSLKRQKHTQHHRDQYSIHLSIHTVREETFVLVKQSLT